MEQLCKALVIIDMQADYIGKKSKNDFYDEQLVERINVKIAVAEKEKGVIIYVKNVGRRNKEYYVSDFTERLSVVSDNIFEKDKSSIFSNEALLKLLRDNNVNEIELVGIDGNCCVASSAIAAAELGFKVTVLTEYVGTKSRDRFIKTRQKLLKAGVEIKE